MNKGMDTRVGYHGPTNQSPPHQILFPLPLILISLCFFSPNLIAMDTQPNPLHILFFPFLAHGHLLPVADVARLFALRGVKCTILTTQSNESIIRPTIDRTNQTLIQANERENENTNRITNTSTYPLVPISVAFIPFPSTEVGLPIGMENASGVSSSDIRERFIRAIFLLEKPFEQALRDLCPDAVVSDTFFTFSADVAIRFGVPRIAFNGMGLLARCASVTILHLLESLPKDVETVSIPGFPHHLELYRTQILDPIKNKEDIAFHKLNSEADARSYGEIVNSFLELEPDYAVYLREVIGRKAWVIGPVTLDNEDMTDKSCRGDKAGIDMDELILWLDNKRTSSVIYVSFGTLARFPNEQLREIAFALEQGESSFIWVVKDADKEGTDDWMPQEFEERITREKKGLIIRGWAPQVPILNHEAVGGFVTHCGWNSSLEAISAGLPMVTWPLSSDQFYNEKLIVEILRVGVAIGANQTGECFEKKQFIDASTINNVIAKVMDGGEKAEAMKRRAKELKEKARRAVQEGGSSHVDLKKMLDELREMRIERFPQINQA